MTRMIPMCLEYEFSAKFSMDEGYKAMASDEAREKAAEEWCNAPLTS